MCRMVYSTQVFRQRPEHPYSVARTFFTNHILCVDAARDPEFGKTGLGWMLRNKDGLIQWAGTIFLHFTMDVDWAELLAIKLPLTRLQTNFENLPILSDSTNAIDLIRLKANISDHDLLAQDIRLEAAKLCSPEFFHIPRSYNLVAHDLVQKALHSCITTVWTDSMPMYVGTHVLKLFG
ncbi:hypothetical protein Scep_001765 [Stephania cephalantha]|uniref:RNase H type-1 domain-containing protein n=1 Tax=Stephania cephalantha TaxID=152367 RepID=A0AAP0LCM6_9MAGN